MKCFGKYSEVDRLCEFCLKIDGKLFNKCKQDRETMEEQYVKEWNIMFNCRYGTYAWDECTKYRACMLTTNGRKNGECHVKPECENYLMED